jgi:hypothetical protein
MMELTKELYAAHQQLSNCSIKFLEFARNHPEALDRSNFSPFLATPGFDYFDLHPWPTFIDKEAENRVKEAVLKVFSLIRSLPGRLFDYDYRKISRYYEIPEHEAQWMLYGVDDNHMNGLVGRGDFIFSTAAGFKCLEFNMRSNLGGWEVVTQNSLYINTPVISGFIKENNLKLQEDKFFTILIEHVLDRAFERFSEEPGKEINMAIAFPGTIGNDKGKGQVNVDGKVTEQLSLLYKYILQQKNNAFKGNLFLCDIEGIRRVGDFAMFGDKKIHIMIEKCDGFVPVVFLEVLKKQNLFLYNGPISGIMSNKFNLSLLSEREDSDAFSQDERAVIKKYIPWTRKIMDVETTFGTEKIKLGDFIISNKERLVIKPSRGLGGEDVMVGFNTSPGEWKKYVEKALLEKTWVVQEFIQPDSYLYQTGSHGCARNHVVWGCLAIGSHYAGSFMRVLPEADSKGVINAKQGALVSNILVVEE